MYHHADDIPDQTVQAKVKQKVRAILPNVPDSEMSAAFDDANGGLGGYVWANRIRAFVEHELRFGA